MRQLLIDLVPQCATATPPALLCVRSWAAVLVLGALRPAAPGRMLLCSNTVHQLLGRHAYARAAAPTDKVWSVVLAPNALAPRTDCGVGCCVL